MTLSTLTHHDLTRERCTATLWLYPVTSELYSYHCPACDVKITIQPREILRRRYLTMLCELLEGVSP